MCIKSYDTKINLHNAYREENSRSKYQGMFRVLNTLNYHDARRSRAQRHVLAIVGD